jgi:hypothetical protein
VTVNFLKVLPYAIEKLDRSLEARGSAFPYVGIQKILKSLQLGFQVWTRKLGVKMGGYHQIELKRNASLKSPDFSKSLHGVTGMAENNPLEKIELALE